MSRRCGSTARSSRSPAAYCFGTGPASETPSGWTGFVKTRPELELPDIQFLFRAVATKAAPYLPPFKPAYADGFSLRAVMLHPESRGEIDARLGRPARSGQDSPEFPRDRRRPPDDPRRAEAGPAHLRDAAAQRLCRRASWPPAPTCKATRTLDAYIRATAATAHHPLGTCKMGPASDPTAVVDPELRVRGVDGLRVVDASVMPDMVGGNINAPVIMIAEKAADLIRGRPAPGPAIVPAR